MAGGVEIKLLLDHGADWDALVEQKEPVMWVTGHGPMVLNLVLDTGTCYARQGEVLDEVRLEIADLMMERGAMMSGVIAHFRLREVLKFERFRGCGRG
ncbi:hypothetical protein BJX70DRAFT_12193 [Aspergillus crustosus]